MSCIYHATSTAGCQSCERMLSAAVRAQEAAARVAESAGRMGDSWRRTAERAARREQQRMADIERAEAQRVENALAAAADTRADRDARSVVRQRGVSPVDAKQLDAWISTFAQLFGRPLSIVRVDRDRGVAVLQRCRACGAEILSRVPNNLTSAADPMAVMAVVAHSVRHDYDSHRCPPIDVALHGCSAEELDALLQSTESDAQKLAERAALIEKRLKEMSNV